MATILKMQREKPLSGGYTLVANLVIRANAQSMSAGELAGALGVTASYLSQLLSGLRDAEMCGRPFLTACAQFLELPLIYIYVLADLLTIEEAAGFDAESAGYMRACALDYREEYGASFRLAADSAVFES
jgi:hypothetical protein